MGIAALITGTVFVGLGFWARVSPQSMSGFGAEWPDRRENIDMEGLAICLRNGFIAIGLGTVAGYYLFSRLGLGFLSGISVVAAPFIGILVLMAKARKYDRNEEKRGWGTFVFLAIVAVAVLGMMAYGYMPAGLSADRDSVRISGMYGTDINPANISGVELSETIPPVIMRTNGLSMSGANKGFFTVEGYGRTRLFTHPSNKGPFIVITGRDGNKTVFQTKDHLTAEEQYSMIRSLVGL